MRPILTIPGLWNSGPQHWQTHWEAKHPEWRRVQQRDFDHPDRDEWVAALDAAIRASTEKPILAAHSLGCMLVAQWAQLTGGEGIAGAFLVAPSDCEAAGYPIDAGAFKPIPLAPFSFPSIVVASTNDEYVTLDRAKQFADAWGSGLIVIGDAGHINGASGYGPWPESESLLRSFADRL
ncbi:MAG TPA: alpha/beta hydrolase [Thermoanaerobaculia bacterium]|nr:alpha/beta hydrolase [Thermoanaerobaculia bacterium]